MDIEKEINQQVEKMRQEIMNFTSSLIQFPSLQGNEEGAQLFLEKNLRKLGCETDVFTPDPVALKQYEDVLVTREDFSKSPNVVGILKGSGGGKSLILNSHIDVVPVGDQDWSENAFGGNIIDGKIFGRGASDMKGGAAANYFALKALTELGIKLKGDVIIESVVDEECGGAGTAAALLKGYRADAAIISEPTDMKVYPACMGSMWFRVKVKGRAAHGAMAYLGINAIDKAYVVYQSLKDLENIRREKKTHPLYKDFEIPFCINVGKFSGGNWPSSVPDEVVMEGRMGISPDETITEARSELENAIGTAAASDSWLTKNPPSIEWFGSCWLSGAIPEDHPIVKSVINNHAKEHGNLPKVAGAPWATDAGLLIRYGNTPSVVYGPGKGSMAHQANEYILIEDMLRTIKVLAHTIVDWCS